MLQISKIFINFIMLCVFWLNIGSVAFANSATQVSIIDMDGHNAKIMVRKASGSNIPATLGMNLEVGDSIITDDNGTAELSLADGSLVKIGLNTEYKVETIKTEGNGLVSWAFELVKGSIRGLIEKSPKKDFVKFKVYSPTGTMGVRGTEFVYSYDKRSQKTELFTMSGTVMLGGRRADFQKPASFVQVGMGQRSFVRPTQGGNFVPAPAKNFEPEDLFKVVPPSSPAEGPGTSQVAPEEKQIAKEEKNTEELAKAKMALFEKMDKVESNIKENHGRTISAPNAKKILERSEKEMSARQSQAKSARPSAGTSSAGNNRVDAATSSKAGIAAGATSKGTMNTPRGGGSQSASTEAAPRASSSQVTRSQTQTTNTQTTNTQTTVSPAVQRPSTQSESTPAAAVARPEEEKIDSVVNKGASYQTNRAAEVVREAEPVAAPAPAPAQQPASASRSVFEERAAPSPSLQTNAPMVDDAPVARSDAPAVVNSPARSAGSAVIAEKIKAAVGKGTLLEVQPKAKAPITAAQPAASDDLEKNAALMLGGVDSKQSKALPSTKAGQSTVATPVSKIIKTVKPLIYRQGNGDQGGAGSTR